MKETIVYFSSDRRRPISEHSQLESEREIGEERSTLLFVRPLGHVTSPSSQHIGHLFILLRLVKADWVVKSTALYAYVYSRATHPYSTLHVSPPRRKMWHK